MKSRKLPPDLCDRTTLGQRRRRAEAARRAEQPGWAAIDRLFHIDAQERRRCHLRPRSSKQAFRIALSKKNITMKKNKGVCLYLIDSYLSIYPEIYNNRAASCSRHTTASLEQSHLIATPEIINNPIFVTRSQLKKMGIGCKRLFSWVRSWKIIPYYNPTTNKLLYPLPDVLHLAEWRHAQWIAQKLGPQKMAEIKNSRPRKTVIKLSLISYSYHLPEYIHL